jgi:hypothetical protein
VPCCQGGSYSQPPQPGAPQSKPAHPAGRPGPRPAQAGQPRPTRGLPGRRTASRDWRAIMAVWTLIPSCGTGSWPFAGPIPRPANGGGRPRRPQDQGHSFGVLVGCLLGLVAGDSAKRVFRAEQGEQALEAGAEEVRGQSSSPVPEQTAGCRHGLPRLRESAWSCPRSSGPSARGGSRLRTVSGRQGRDHHGRTSQNGTARSA